MIPRKLYAGRGSAFLSPLSICIDELYAILLRSVPQCNTRLINKIHIDPRICPALMVHDSTS